MNMQKMGKLCKENWNCYGADIAEYQNVLWTHTADMVASRVLGV